MASSYYIGGGEGGGGGGGGGVGGGGWAPMAPPLDPPLFVKYSVAQALISLFLLPL